MRAKDMKWMVGGRGGEGEEGGEGQYYFFSKFALRLRSHNTETAMASKRDLL
jgi:hypothetical protein